MADEYALAILKISLAQLCQNVGFQSGTNISLSVLLDIYRRYMETLCKTLRRYCDHNGRTEPIFEDVEITFSELRISLPELNDYANQVAPVPFKYNVSLFPIPRPNRLKIPPPGSEELLTRPDYIPTYLPLMKPEPEPPPPSEQQAADAGQSDSAFSAGKITSARGSKATITLFGKQNLMQSNELVGDFSDFDAVKAGLVKFVRIPTPPPAPRVATPLAVSYPSAMSPVAFSSPVQSTAISSPVITVAEETKSKKQPTVLAVRPDAHRFQATINPPRAKLKINLPYKKKRAMPPVVQKREKKLIVPSSNEAARDGAGHPIPPVPKRRGRPPGKVGRPPKQRPVAIPQPTTEVEKKADVSTESIAADAPANLDTSSASSSIEDLVTSVIEATRNRIKAQQIASEHFADSVNSVVVAQVDAQPIDLSKTNDSDLAAPDNQSRIEPEPQAQPSEIVQPAASSEGASTSAAADASNSERLKSILSHSRRLLNKEIIKQRLKDKSAKRDAEEKKIQAVVEKNFTPIAKRQEEPAPVQTPVATAAEAIAKPPRRPPGLPPTSLLLNKQKTEKPLRTAPKQESEKAPVKKYEPPPLFQPEHISKTVVATPAAADFRKVAPLVISKKAKPPAQSAPVPPPVPQPKQRESTKLIIKLPQKRPSSALADKESRRHEHVKGNEKQKEKHREKHQAAETDKEKKIKQPQKVDFAPEAMKKPDSGPAAVATSSPKVPKLKINLGKPKPDKSAPEQGPKTKEKKITPLEPADAATYRTQLVERADAVCEEPSLSPPPKSPTAYASSPADAGSGGFMEGGYESPPPPTPSPGSSSPPSPVPLDARAEQPDKSGSQISSPPAKKQRIEHDVRPETSQPAETLETAPSTSQEDHQANDGVWYCPVCSVPYVDDGPAMIACDMCDRWFHWSCVGLMQAPPADENWYCQQCRIQQLSSSFKHSAAGQKRKQKASMIKKRHK